MKRARILRLGLVLLLVAAGSAGLAVWTRARQANVPAQPAAVYYCPMHPTYTSDRPGDCPICNMRLVKAEPEAAPGEHAAEHAADAEPPKTLTSICYLHNCPRAHAGQPCPMTVIATPGEEVTCPICGTHIAEATTSAERKILYWTDPMLPGYRADGPGTSPMGMALIPVYEEASPGEAAPAPAGYAPVLLSPYKQQLIGVKTAAAARRPLVKTIRTVGRVAYDPELYQAQEEFLQAVRAAVPAQTSAIQGVAAQSARLVESARLRLRLLGLTDALIDEVQALNAADERLLLADRAGEAWVYAPVYEYELPLVTVGQTLRGEVSALPGRALEGVVRAVDPVLDPQTRTARVRALVRDPQGLLKPQMFMNVTLTVDAGEALAVPREAVFSTGTRHLVFVAKGQGLFEPRDVTPGVEAEGWRAIVDGLAPGEPVVTSGNFLIDSESRLKAAIEGFSGEAAHTHEP